MGPTEVRGPRSKYHSPASIGANNPSRPTLPPWWLSSSSESRPTLGGNEMGRPSHSQRPLLVVWWCCCLSPENVSVGPRSQSCSSPFCCFCFAAYTRNSVSLLTTTASSRPCLQYRRPRCFHSLLFPFHSFLALPPRNPPRSHGLNLALQQALSPTLAPL